MAKTSQKNVRGNDVYIYIYIKENLKTAIPSSCELEEKVWGIEK
jgi:hypothetical protein